MKKIGAVSGKFRILHNAHKEYILKATLHVEILHIFIVNDETIKRYSSVRETQLAIINILKGIDIEYHIHISPRIDSMLDWDNYVIATIGSKDVVMFNSKEEYSNVILSTGYINCQHALNISASEIEKNPYLEHNFANVASEYMRFLNKKIVITGIRGIGKTQLIKKYAKINQTVSSKDMTKDYINNVLDRNDEKIVVNDFEKITINQIINNNQGNESARRFIVNDNDFGIILNDLNKCFENSNLVDENEYKQVKKNITKLWYANKADLVIMLKPSKNLKEHRELCEIYHENNIVFHELEIENYTKCYENMSEIITKEFF